MVNRNLALICQDIISEFRHRQECEILGITYLRNILICLIIGHLLEYTSEEGLSLLTSYMSLVRL